MRKVSMAVLVACGAWIGACGSDSTPSTRPDVDVDQDVPADGTGDDVAPDVPDEETRPGGDVTDPDGSPTPGDAVPDDGENGDVDAGTDAETGVDAGEDGDDDVEDDTTEPSICPEDAPAGAVCVEVSGDEDQELRIGDDTLRFRRGEPGGFVGWMAPWSDDEGVLEGVRSAVVEVGGIEARSAMLIEVEIALDPDAPVGLALPGQQLRVVRQRAPEEPFVALSGTAAVRGDEGQTIAVRAAADGPGLYYLRIVDEEQVERGECDPFVVRGGALPSDVVEVSQACTSAEPVELAFPGCAANAGTSTAVYEGGVRWTSEGPRLALGVRERGRWVIFTNAACFEDNNLACMNGSINTWLEDRGWTSVTTSISVGIGAGRCTIEALAPRATLVTLSQVRSATAGSWIRWRDEETDDLLADARYTVDGATISLELIPTDETPVAILPDWLVMRFGP